jgi:alkanesulfonate monooxygenase
LVFLSQKEQTMTIKFLWRIPVHGDGRRAHQLHTRGEWNDLVAGQAPQRLAPRFGDADFGYYDYIEQVAKAADLAGFHGALIPAFPFTEEPWVLAAALARQTQQLRLLIAIQPWFIHPAYASQMAASLQRLSSGRVEWNVISGGGGSQQKSYGDFVDHDRRYQRTAEFLQFVKGYSKQQPFDFKGEFFSVEQGGLIAPMNQYPIPRLWLAGASAAALHVAGQHADVHLTWAEPIEQQKQQIEQSQQFLALHYPQRQISYGIRIDILARPTYEQAVDELKQIYQSDAKPGPRFASRDSESIGAQRQSALAEGKQFEQLFHGRHFWGGMSALRGGPNGILVGSYQQVAAYLQQYIEIGVSHFILASNPHLEEAYRVAEEVLPLIQRSAVKAEVKPQPAAVK